MRPKLRCESSGAAFAPTPLAPVRKSLAGSPDADTERYQVLADLASEWYWEQDEHLRFAHVSPAIRRLSTLSAEDHQGKTLWELPQTRIPADQMHAYRAAVDARQNFAGIILYRQANNEGGECCISISGKPVFDDAGRFKGYRGVGQDITERVMSEAVFAVAKHVLEMLSADRPQGEILSVLGREVETILRNCLAVILVVDNDRQRMRVATAPGFPTEVLNIVVDSPPEIPDCGAAEAKPHLSHDLSDDPLWIGIRNHCAVPHTASWSVPVNSRNGTLGRLVLYFTTPRSPTQFERHALDRVCQLAALAIEHTRKNDFMRLALDVFQNIDDGIIISDADNNVVQVNPAFTRITGYRPDEVIGRNPSVLSPSAYGQPSFYWPMWDTLTKTEHWQGALRDRRKDGSDYYKKLSVSVTRDKAGHATHYTGVFSDITHEKETEQRLRMRHDITRILGESGSVEDTLRNVCRVVCQSLKLDAGTFWSARKDHGGLLCNVFWCDPDQDQNRFAKLVGEIRLNPDIDIARQAWMHGVFLGLNDLTRGKTRPGQPTDDPMLDEALYLPLMTEKELLGVLAFHGAPSGSSETSLMDITHSLAEQVETFLVKRRSEAALRSREEALRLITDNLPAGIVYYDRNFFCCFANPGYASFFNLSPTQIVGRHIEAVLGKENFDNEAAYYQRALGGETVSYQRAHDRPSGDIHFMEVMLVPARSAQETIIGCYALCHDVTEQVRAEREIRILNTELEDRVRDRTRQMEAVVKELEAFSYSVSHDLRAPLRGIDGFARLLAQRYADKLDDTGSDYLARICKGSRRMGELIDDLLALSQVTRGTLARSTVDLTGICKEVLDNLHATHPDRDVSVRIEENIRVDGDPRQLRIAMENLLANAWKFSSRRADASISVGTTQTQRGRAIFVRDNGAGFDMRYAGKLFNSFQRLHSAGEFEGTGIGLAIVQRIVNRHGGSIWAESEPGRGATFYVAL